MGCTNSEEEKIDTELIDEKEKIEKNKIKIAEEREKAQTVIKILLLGASDTGKSTFTKQIQAIYLGFPEKERLNWKELICDNIITSIKGLINAASKNRLELSILNKDIAERLLAVNTMAIDPEMGQEIKSIYTDPAVIQTYELYNTFHFVESSHFFLSNIDRIAQTDYIPSMEDILRCRANTVGIQEVNIEIEQNKFSIVDVGGARNERKKWIQGFDDVTAVIFFMSLNEYDLKLYEDDDTNRMHESLKLFEEVCTSKWFIGIPIILFLNKMDLFKEKIKKVNITTAFPNYDGPQAYAEASQYIQSQFLALNKAPQKEVFPHITCATNTDSIKTVFIAVKSIVLKKIIEDLYKF